MLITIMSPLVFFLTMITNSISRRLINADVNVIQAFAGQVLVAPIFVHLTIF